MGSRNVSGQAYAFMAMTPIQPGQEAPLADYLRGLHESGPSPLAKLPRTHFARFVVIEDFHHDPSWGQRREDHLDLSYLVFTCNFDGDLDSYLDELCAKLAPEARHIWGRCVGCPEDPVGQALKGYLEHNQIQTGLFFAAYAHAPVNTVLHALDQRERMIGFASTSQGLEPQLLQQAFLREFGRRG